MNGGNVLPLFDPPRQKTFRAAIAKIIRDIKARDDLTNTELAEIVGCCADTVSNAENENNDLSGVTLLRIGYYFGEEAIAPALELFRRRYQQPKTLAERFAEIQNELAAIAKAMESA